MLFNPSENSDDDSISSSILTQPTENISRNVYTLNCNSFENTNSKMIQDVYVSTFCSDKDIITTEECHIMYIPSWYDKVI